MEKLGQEIFALVEYDQGRGFISDGITQLKSEQAVYGTVRTALRATERAARKIRHWLKKRGQLT